MVQIIFTKTPGDRGKKQAVERAVKGEVVQVIIDTLLAGSVTDMWGALSEAWVLVSVFKYSHEC